VGANLLGSQLSSSRPPCLGAPTDVASRWLRHPRHGIRSQGISAGQNDGEDQAAGQACHSRARTERNHELTRTFPKGPRSMACDDQQGEHGHAYHVNQPGKRVAQSAAAAASIAVFATTDHCRVSVNFCSFPPPGVRWTVSLFGVSMSNLMSPVTVVDPSVTWKSPWYLLLPKANTRTQSPCRCS
jgi:hypothetical protein